MDHIIFTWGTYSLTFRMVISVIIMFFLVKVSLFFVKFLLEKRIKNSVNEHDRLLSIFQLIRYFVWILAFGVMCDQLGIKLTFLLAGSAALLVGLGLGLQQTFNDIISGIIILAEGSLKKNDVVEVDNLIGKVNEINLRTSEIVTRDGIFILVPNHKLINENVINWSHHSRATRFRVNVGVAYDSNVDLVRRILRECIENEKHVIIDDPEKFTINVRIINFGDNSIDFEILFWSNEIFHIEQVKSNLRFRILQTFKENDISIPFPQRDIHFKNNTNL